MSEHALSPPTGDTEDALARCLARWRALVQRLGGARLGARPTTTWATLSSISATLTDLVLRAPGNVLVFPCGDQQTLTLAQVSRVPGCLELRCGSDLTIARPLSLKLELLAPDPQAALAYFRLETAPLVRRGPSATPQVPGLEPFDLESGYARLSGGKSAGAGPASRRFSGAFLLVSACSPYLRNADVIAGVNNSLPPAQLREVLGVLARRLAGASAALPPAHGTAAKG